MKNLIKYYKAKMVKVKNFSFPIKSHIEIGEKNNQIDFKTSSKLSGSRFVILKTNFARVRKSIN